MEDRLCERLRVCVIELWVIELCVKELRESAACDKERLCVCDNVVCERIVCERVYV